MMAADPISALGLLGLFNVCLEGYRLCLTAKDAGSDFAILRARMLLERERFVNVCAAFGLSESEHGNNSRAKALRRYIEKDAFRRRGIAETLEAVALLLAKAEKADRRYSDRDEVPDVAKDKKVDERLQSEIALLLCIEPSRLTKLPESRSGFTRQWPPNPPPLVQ
jgi:hypothetical protein